jgi:hypothetical protein
MALRAAALHSEGVFGRLPQVLRGEAICLESVYDNKLLFALICSKEVISS